MVLLACSQVGELARSMGFQQVSLSSVVMPMVKMVPRGFTAAADAYLTPHIMRCAAHWAGALAGLLRWHHVMCSGSGYESPQEAS